ncbi:MAG: hypothetical protein K2Q18_02820, partial [Bdellovibrionales bacterium]|nr:hypothetical protein [Bdellovibrionales bacterium]
MSQKKETINEILNRFYQSENFSSAFTRREELITEMDNLEKASIHCMSCPGTCCTFQANSMQITPIEALEILHGLNFDDYTDLEKESFKARMKKTVSEYRLDVEVYTGKKNSTVLRKNYTCPFFNNGSLGCSLSRSTKPYGCLGFNPKKNEDNGKSCASNTDLLQNRENHFLMNEDLVNS